MSDISHTSTGNVTLRAVAAHAGVSKSVVSRVLQGSPHVSDERRRVVEQVIAELGYRPNATARSLTQRRTNAIGVLVNDLRQPWLVDFLADFISRCTPTSCIRSWVTADSTELQTSRCCEYLWRCVSTG